MSTKSQNILSKSMSAINNLFSKLGDSSIVRSLSPKTKRLGLFVSKKVLSLGGLKLFATMVFILAMVMLALPEFKVKIGDVEFTYPSVGFARIGLPVDYPSFRQGKEIYSSYAFSAKVNFGENEIPEDQKLDSVATMLDTVRKRISSANLSDIESYSEKINNEYFIVVKVPQNYSDPEQYARWISGKGVVVFENFQLIGEEFSENPILINDTDIQGIYSELNVRYSREGTDANGNPSTQIEGVRAEHLAIRIDPRKISELVKLPTFVEYASTVNSGQPYLTNIVFDGFVSFNVFRDEFDANIIRAFPQGSLTNASARDQMNVAISYFKSNPLEFELTIDDASPASLIVASYNPEGGTFIAISTIISFAIVALYLLRIVGVRKMVLIMLAWSITLLTIVNFAKLMILPINVGTIIGFYLAGIFTLWIIKTLFEGNIEIYKANRKHFLNIIVILLFLIAGITASGIVVENLREITSILVAMILTVLPMMYTIYHFSLNTFNKIINEQNK